MSNTPAFVIIGNGVAGITAAREARKLHPDLRIQVISAESSYFFSRTALMYIFMGHMRLQDTEPYERSFYEENRLELVSGLVVSIDPAACKVRLDSGDSLSYDYLLIASGSRPNYFGWPGQELEGVQGLYSLQDLHSLQERVGQGRLNQAVIVGGGLIGIELAEMLHFRGIPVRFLVREQSYWNNVLPPEESQLVNAEIAAHHIPVHFDTELAEILGDEAGQVRGVKTGTGEQIDCDFVGLTAGVSPNLACLQDSGIECQRGVLVDQWLRSSSERVYAAGDCAQFRDENGAGGRIEQLWYTAKMQGAVVGRQVAADAWQQSAEPRPDDPIDVSPYDRGIWYNSAKFFTIEYQTYGYVPNQIPDELSHVWVDMNTKQLLRLYWEIDEQGHRIIKGMNSMGLRFRHTVFADWIATQTRIEHVVDQLALAAFDPEFSRQRIGAFLGSWNKKYSPAGVH